jgi:hypothetical protein
MQITVRDPLRGRLVTIDVEFTDANTTWFDHCENDDDIYLITDIDEGLLIKELGYAYPLLIQGKSRANIGHDKQKALELIDWYDEYP